MLQTEDPKGNVLYLVTNRSDLSCDEIQNHFLNLQIDMMVRFNATLVYFGAESSRLLYKNRICILFHNAKLMQSIKLYRFVLFFLLFSTARMWLYKTD